MVHCLYDLIRPGTEGSGKREKRESARTPARVREREKKRESARARARSFLGLDAHVQEGRHMHTGSHMHRAGLGTAGARLCRADDTGGWTRWRPPAPRPAAHCSRTPSGADLFAVCRPNPQRSAGRPLRGRRGRAYDAGICTPRPRGSGGADGPTLLVIASRFRPVWRRLCTCWRSAPGRASTDSARARRRLPLGI